MIRLAKLLLAAALLAIPGSALAQSTLLQGGSWSTGRVPMYVGSGGAQTVVQDSGPASGGGPGIGVSELNITARGTGTAPYAGQGTGPNGEVFCVFDAPATNATGYHSLCFSANVSSGGLISYQANGAASAFPLNFKVNGVEYEFPFTTSGVVGPASSTINNAACWNNTSGTLLKDCGAFVTVGGNNTWTGTNNFTGTFQIGGITQTFPASGALVGTSDSQTLTNKSIGASQINSGTLSAVVMPAFTGDVTTSAGAVATTIANNAVSNAKLATATQNTVKGAATSTAMADLTMPSCSGASNALQWTTNTGFGCGTLGATTAGWGVTISGGGVISIATAQPPYAFDLPVNLGLTASVGASALTINVTGANGSAPSATNPVSVPFRSTTLATGTPNWTAITSALSITVPSAATLGTSNNVPFRIWIFLQYNAGTPVLGVAVCSVQASTVTFYPCATWEGNRVTTTTISGFATSAGVLYSSNGVSNDAVRIIGYADYASGLATAGSWASVPTTLQLVSPQTPRPGTVVQTVTGSSTTAATNASATFVAFTNGQTLAITPTNTINPVRATNFGTVGTSAGSAAFVQLVRGSTLIGNPIGTSTGGGPGTTQPAVMFVIDNPQTTSSTTYTYHGKTAGGTLSYPPATSGVYMLLEEIMG